jgi:hypothetical protein
VQYLWWSARCLRKMRNVAAILEPGQSSFRSYYRGRAICVERNSGVWQGGLLPFRLDHAAMGF